MPNDIMVQGPRMGRPGMPGGRPGGMPGGRPGGFPGGFPGRFPERPRFPIGRRFPRRRFPPFFFPIIISPPSCFRFDRFGRCCDRYGWCCDRFGRCGWEWEDEYASVPTMAMPNNDNSYGMPGYWDMMQDEDDMDYDED